MKKFAWGICYSTSKCCSTDIVLETLKTFSETWLFCVFQAQVSWLVCCLTLKISSSLGTGRGLYEPLARLKFWKMYHFQYVLVWSGTDVPVSAQPQSTGERCPIRHFEVWLIGKSSLSLTRVLISDSQLTSFSQKYRRFLL